MHYLCGRCLRAECTDGVMCQPTAYTKGSEIDAGDIGDSVLKYVDEARKLMVKAGFPGPYFFSINDDSFLVDDNGYYFIQWGESV